MYTLHNGDALSRDILPAGCADLIVTSPPYNLGIDYGEGHDDNISYEHYRDFSIKWLENALYWTRSTGRLCLNIPMSVTDGQKVRRPIMPDLAACAMAAGWCWRENILWIKPNRNKSNQYGSWMSASAPNITTRAEGILVLFKDEWKRAVTGQTTITKDEFLLWRNGLWDFEPDSEIRSRHPAPFPRDIPRRCIRLFSFREDVVLDPFAGSGTTIVEALAQERQALGIEISRKYCDIANHRIRRVQMSLFSEQKSEGVDEHEQFA